MNRGNSLLVAFSFAAALGTLTASAQQADQTNFLADAIRGNVAEVKLGQLAAERAQSQQVREYGDMLKKDHTKSLEKTRHHIRTLHRRRLPSARKSRRSGRLVTIWRRLLSASSLIRTIRPEPHHCWKSPAGSAVPKGSSRKTASGSA